MHFKGIRLSLNCISTLSLIHATYHFVCIFFICILNIYLINFSQPGKQSRVIT
ncbi:hypothetical protein HanRHA438_Chr01g0030531 [Helianthus annuus]|nr:hypothetical protein HanHA89_Chr01g0026521 [Helianthus annuus]KAJ0783812.1 hypothetical protein HanLR1_Chr01g0025111 [Helianthus annuus]KAJ0948705.1 hypothetical protein HanRHA438_Chr01g0030531 [Helianthus annuus]KAJ0957579.1 hypothetical protein HanPSC8_Chr01g0029151 [Helianthus annuus]